MIFLKNNGIIFCTVTFVPQVYLTARRCVTVPNIKSAKKRVLVNATKAERNKAVKSNLKTVLKKADAALEANSADKAEVVKLAVKTVDKAAAKGILSKNCASRKKSSLACRLNKASV